MKLKFKIGDKVKRIICNCEPIYSGNTYIVEEIDSSGVWLKGFNGKYSLSFFVLDKIENWRGELE